MTNKNIINSSVYWDGRFEEDWETREGPRQSRFFSHIAIDNLPPWFLKEINRNAFSLVDWGCAQGDGTDVWASYMASEHIFGVDFSAVAIDQAMKRYPAIRFITQDWVASQSCDEQFDVVFSSNTLEHFHTPYDVLKSISKHAKKAVVLALPYREHERIDEHFYSFLPENIPAVLANGFRLTWCQVIDCRLLPNTLWGGDQVILIYGEPEWLDSLGLTLADCLIDVVDTKSEIKRLSSDIDLREAELLAASQLIECQKREIESLRQQVASHADQLSGIEGKFHALKVEKERETSVLKDSVNEKLGAIIALKDLLHEREGEIDLLKITVREKHGEISALSQAVIDRDRWLDEYNQQMLLLKGSRSWKITAPLRTIGSALKSPAAASANSLESQQKTSAVFIPDAASSLWRKRLAYLTSRFQSGIQRHGFVRSMPLALRASHRLGSVWLHKQIKRRTYEQKLVQLRKIITGHTDFIDIFHVPMGWDTPLFQRFQHMSLQAAQLGGLALYGGHLQVDKDLFVFNRAEGNVIVFDALDDQVVQCVFDSLAIVSQSKMLRLQSIDLATRISDVERFLRDGITVVYEYIDEISEEITGAIPGFVIDRHKWLLKNEQVFIVATSDKLFAEVNKHRANHCILSTNGVDLPHWQKNVLHPPADMEPALASGRTIVGYHGALANWIDYELLKKIADVGKYELVLIGYAHDESLDQSGILEHPNVHFLGSKSYFILNEYAAFYNVGILPFKRYELTESVSPVKLFEYMAASKPVVTTYLTECTKYKSCLVSNTHDDFLRNLEIAARAKDDSAYMADLADDAARNSWPEKALSVYSLAGIRTGKR